MTDEIAMESLTLVSDTLAGHCLVDDDGADIKINSINYKYTIIIAGCQGQSVYNFQM